MLLKALGNFVFIFYDQGTKVWVPVDVVMLYFLLISLWELLQVTKLSIFLTWGHVMLTTETSECLIRIQTTIILKGTFSNTDTWVLGEQDQDH